jgi:hypothetical protein
LNSAAASGVAAGLIPQILNTCRKAKDPNDSSFEILQILLRPSLVTVIVLELWMPFNNTQFGRPKFMARVDQ